MNNTKIGLRLSVAISFVMLSLCLNLLNIHALDNKNTITFDNQSGKIALVKLIGPTARIVEVPYAQSRTVNVSAGQYYILTRYGSSPKQYSYSKGDPFIVRDSATQYSAITITLHKVIGGNYPSQPSSRKEFDRVALAKQTIDTTRTTFYQAQKILAELGYNPGQIDGIWGKKTEGAVKKFQRNNDLPVTGKLDAKTKEKLGLLIVSAQKIIDVIELFKYYCKPKTHFNAVTAYRKNEEHIKSLSKKTYTDKLTYVETVALQQVHTAELIDMATAFHNAYKVSAHGNFADAYKDHKNTIEEVANKDWRIYDIADFKEKWLCEVESAVYIDVAIAFHNAYKVSAHGNFADAYKDNKNTIEKVANGNYRKYYMIKEIQKLIQKAICEVWTAYQGHK